MHLALAIGLARWWHLGTDVLWLVNGLVFYVLLFTTGQWQRLVPTTWDVFPSAVSVHLPVLLAQRRLPDDGGVPSPLRRGVRQLAAARAWAGGEPRCTEPRGTA